MVAVAFAAANYKAVFAWLSYEFGNNLWNILTAIGTLTAAVVAYYALNQAKRNAERATFDQYFSQRLASIRETVFDERLSKKTIFYRYKGSDGQKKEQQIIKELLSGAKYQNVICTVMTHGICRHSKRLYMELLKAKRFKGFQHEA